MKNLIALAIATLCLTACMPLLLLNSALHQDDSSPVPNSTPTATLKLSLTVTCDEKTKSFMDRTDLVKEPEVAVIIERDFQRVIRKGCDGQVTTDAIETVKSPRLDFDLKPSRPLARTPDHVRIFENETCDDRSTTIPQRSWTLNGMMQSLNATKDGTVTVKMDMADAWGTFTVTSGWNTMYYTYADGCGDNKYCTGNEIQSGVFRVFVNYVEKTLDGSQTILATRDQCEKAK